MCLDDFKKFTLDKTDGILPDLKIKHFFCYVRYIYTSDGGPYRVPPPSLHCDCQVNVPIVDVIRNDSGTEMVEYQELLDTLF